MNAIDLEMVEDLILDKIQSLRDLYDGDPEIDVYLNLLDIVRSEPRGN